jgi:hypothetical protein
MVYVEMLCGNVMWKCYVEMWKCGNQLKSRNIFIFRFEVNPFLFRLCARAWAQVLMLTTRFELILYTPKMHQCILYEFLELEHILNDIYQYTYRTLK